VIQNRGHDSKILSVKHVFEETLSRRTELEEEKLAAGGD